MAINIHHIDEEIKIAKSELSGSAVDFKKAFDLMDAKIERDICEIEEIVSRGESPIPEISFHDLSSADNDFADRVRKRGCVIIRHVFSQSCVDQWNENLLDYVRKNNYFDKQAQKAGMDKYFSALASGKPQIFGLYWSRPQMEARTSPEMAELRSWLNRLWKWESENGVEFNPDQECLYADRLRQREPGDNTLGLSPHIDGGSVERWLDDGYRNVYRHIFSGRIDQYDPFDAAYRTTSAEIPSPAVCSMFRTYQGWTALTRQGPGNGTLNLVPIANTMGWMLLRALQDDVGESSLCEAKPGRAMVVNDRYHAKLLRAYVPIPEVRPGDTVWWHPDVIHGVEDVNNNSGYSNVMYIGAAPDCEKNRVFLNKQRPAFEEGRSSPDFAAENYEIDFTGRYEKSDLSALGRKQMGYQA